MSTTRPVEYPAAAAAARTTFCSLECPCEDCGRSHARKGGLEEGEAGVCDAQAGFEDGIDAIVYGGIGEVCEVKLINGNNAEDAYDTDADALTLAFSCTF